MAQRIVQFTFTNMGGWTTTPTGIPVPNWPISETVFSLGTNIVAPSNGTKTFVGTSKTPATTTVQFMYTANGGTTWYLNNISHITGLTYTDVVAEDSVLSAVLAVKGMLENVTYGLNAIKSAVNTVDTVVDRIEVDTTSIETKVDTVDTVADTISAIVGHATHGNAALKSLITVIDAVVDAIEVDTTAIEADTQDIQAKLAVVDGIVDTIVATTGHATWGNAAIKSLIDTVDTIVDDIKATVNNATYGNSALKVLLDSLATDLAAVNAKTIEIDTAVDSLTLNNTAGFGEVVQNIQSKLSVIRFILNGTIFTE